MPRFAHMLAEGMRARGHRVDMWMPPARLVGLSGFKPLRKWLGYLDQYVLFPRQVHQQIKKSPPDTLFVFTDQALGPWVPLVANRPHAIHCHDFLAQRAALGEIPENPTSWTGRQYQAYIRRGYSQGKHFISVSRNTRDDLHRFLPHRPAISEVVYNGLNQEFAPQDASRARCLLSQKTGVDLTAGYLLHVGGNQWYKNRTGVVEVYNAWRATNSAPLPLLLIGEAPTATLRELWHQSPFQADIHMISGLEDEFVRLAYAGATVFFFPSLDEGFGWPIAEAMAAGCPVITTGHAPMTEVGATAAWYTPRRPAPIDVPEWTADSARMVDHVVNLSSEQRQTAIEAGKANARRFDPAAALDRIEAIYKVILQAYPSA
ncbi:glycosyltransferase [Hymenobacter sp. HDW8]|uniref:glycosyltransferase n=1 Tax=Hymenobacter sp. HDW8 TaxID=2714932 RepID=UPI001F1095F1|nr:glycosyltransferase [Hymenobacter sp. HDW8]